MLIGSGAGIMEPVLGARYARPPATLKAIPLNTIRVGSIGLGANTRLRHVPGLRAFADLFSHSPPPSFSPSRSRHGKAPTY